MESRNFASAMEDPCFSFVASKDGSKDPAVVASEMTCFPHIHSYIPSGRGYLHYVINIIFFRHCANVPSIIFVSDTVIRLFS